jgi:hypothetical protein
VSKSPVHHLAEDNALVSACLREAFESDMTTKGSVTNVYKCFKAGGNLTRTAQETIIDQGTSIEAGGDIKQSARVIKEEAIHDQKFDSKDSQSYDGRVGVYAGAGADAENGGDASAGVKGSYSGSSGGDSSSTSTAVTSKYKAGGNIDSKSEDGTTLVGTRIEAGKDVNIEAGTLDYRAARNSSSKSSNRENVDANVKGAVYGSAGVSAEVDYGKENADESKSTASAGSLSAGGNINLKTTKGDASFEGSNIEGKGKVTVDSAGKANFKAAYDTESSSGTELEVSADFSASKKEANGGASVGYAEQNTSSSRARSGGINGGEVSVKAAGK